jgi:hypothetical protein
VELEEGTLVGLDVGISVGAGVIVGKSVGDSGRQTKSEEPHNEID